MRIIFKILAAPFVLVLTLLVAVLSFLLSLSAGLLSILASVLGLLSVLMLFVEKDIPTGIAGLLMAFAISPFGLPALAGWLLAKYSRKYLAEHEAELADYRAAKATMAELLGGEKLPKMDVLKEKRRQLTARKKALYLEYRKAQQDMRELVAAKPPRNAPDEIVNYDQRVPVENGSFLAWGHLTYTRPLTKRQASDYELRPAPDNPDRPRSIREQMKTAAKQAEADRGQAAPKKNAPDRGDR